VAGIFRGQETGVNKDQVNTAEWLRRGATALAAGRMGLGVIALARPAAVARPWTGSSGESQAGRVLGRATGARDLALGVGTLGALRRPGGPEADQAAAVWVGLSGLCDGFDLLITASSWRSLPTGGRWLVALAAGGSAALSLAAAASLRDPG
jgi:hypothetical protein